MSVALGLLVLVIGLALIVLPISGWTPRAQGVVVQSVGVLLVGLAMVVLAIATGGNAPFGITDAHGGLPTPTATSSTVPPVGIGPGPSEFVDLHFTGAVSGGVHGIGTCSQGALYLKVPNGQLVVHEPGAGPGGMASAIELSIDPAVAGTGDAIDLTLGDPQQNSYDFTSINDSALAYGRTVDIVSMAMSDQDASDPSAVVATVSGTVTTCPRP